MSKDFSPDRLDVASFARAGAALDGVDRLSGYARLMEETAGAGAERTLRWHAEGELREPAGRPAEPWLHLSGEVVLPLVCQRCLGPVDVAVSFDRPFRFVADEATAEAEDDEAEEDLLAMRQDFPLRELVEDEFLMALPPVPCHETCPADLPLSAGEGEFQAAQSEKPHPFAALAALKRDGGKA
ncbi:MAG: DUF177 domain-containing protein [Xylophilus ampelinus]